MIIITIRTDKPEAELGIYQGTTQLTYHIWQAHRQLAETIHQTIEIVLKESKLQLEALDGIVFYKGPGSFTGLRIGASVANALAAGLGVPIVGTTGETWQVTGIEALLAGDNQRLALPEYGAAPHITKPKH
jgi:tRNA threonylcarbamoyladenosine biosynthesis protein TsaB